MKDKLLNIAREKQILDPEMLETALAKQGESGKRLDEVLLESGLFTEDQVLKLFAELLDLPYVEQIDPKNVPAEFISTVPASYAQQHSLVGVDRQNGQMTVATSQPLSLYPMDNVGKMVQCAVKPALALRATINSAISTAYEQRVRTTQTPPSPPGVSSVQ